MRTLRDLAEKLRKMGVELRVIKNSNNLGLHLGPCSMVAYNRVIADCERTARALENHDKHHVKQRTRAVR